MRENEAAALRAIRDQLDAILGGEVPVAQAPVSVKPVARAARAAAAPTGEAQMVYDEEAGGFGCLICGEGVFGAGNAAIHVWEQHQVPLASLVAEGLTHGRKWQMKQALMKAGYQDALEGYGRGEAKAEEAEAQAPKPKPKWGAGKVAKAPAVTASGFEHHIGCIHPDGDPNSRDIYVELLERNGTNWRVRSMDRYYSFGQILEITPKELVYILPWEAKEVHLDKDGHFPPQKAPAPAVAKKAIKPWQKPAAPSAEEEEAVPEESEEEGAPAETEDEAVFAKKYGLKPQHLKYVKDFQKEQGLPNLEAAAKVLNLGSE